MNSRGALSRGRARALALLATLLLVALAFVGRAVLSADDGADMMSDTLGFLVQGRFECATVPPATEDRYVAPPPPFHSRYGLLPSLVPLPFLAPPWPIRRAIGAAALDACGALTWATGVVLAALGFFRLAKALRPEASPFWIPAFLGGTFLWGYVASSFIEPWAAAGLAFAASEVLSMAERPPWRAALLVAAGAVAAYAMRPVLWVTAPVLVLAALVALRGRADAARRAVALLSALGAGLLVIAAVYHVRSGAVSDFGYGFRGAFPFVYPLGAGLLGLTVLPGRGVLWYAPVVIASLVAARRLSWPARILCFGAPLVMLPVVARWIAWHGGACWGPRHLVAVLPLLAAPAVLAPRRLAAGLLAAGVLLNLPGALVAHGAFQAYAERLVPPPGASWPLPGGDRVSEVPMLTPLQGSPWLLLRAAGVRAPAPWLGAGAREQMAPPPFAAMLSPWILRRAAGLPPIPPYVPRLLVRGAAGYLVRGRPAQAALFAREALVLEPRAADAARILQAAGSAEARP